MKRLVPFLCLTFLLMLSSCGKDDDASSSGSFYDNALTSANNADLEGRWSIYQVQFEEQIVDAPVDYIECGRNFFDFQPNGHYKEYIFNDNYECTPQIQMLTWSLSNGVVTFSNGIETDQFVITELTASRLVFKFRLDADSDGDIDILEATCLRYEPPIEIDIYTGSFYWDSNAPNTDKILLKWEAYRGYNGFEKYEIYRLDESCDASVPTLIATITDSNQNFFIDELPEPYEDICYVFKIYTSQALLGESDPITVDTSSIEVPSVNLAPPVLSGTTVQLNWQPYDGYYFSHYEVEVRNYASGSGGGFQEDQIAIINSMDTTNYSVELPYFANPVFVINTYNIFGTRNTTVIEGQNQRSTNFVRQGILPINAIRYFAFSPNETVLYYSDNSNLHRYNYGSRSLENSVELNSSSIGFVNVFQSAFGSEVIVNRGGVLKVYDANLNFKYDLNIEYIFGFTPGHLALSENGYWLITDRQKLYSFSRTTNNLTLINSNNLYNQSFSSSTINVLDIGQNRILAGNHTQSQGLIVGINSNGQLTTTSQTVNLNATSEWKNNSLFSENQQYVLNIEDNTLYSTNTYNLITTLNQEFFPSGLSNDGSRILGTKNNPRPSDDTYQEKKVRTLTYPSLNEQIYISQGYPQVLFQNHLGQIVSISKALIGRLDGYSPQNDIFVEVIE